MLRALAAGALLILPLAGCITRDDLAERWDDLEVEPRYRQAQLLFAQRSFSFTGVFNPQDPPSSQEELGDRWSDRFAVPVGARTMQVTFQVSIANPSEPSPVPIPVPPGSIELFVRSPSGNETENQGEALTASGGGGFDYRRPSPGDWEIGYNARAQGNITLNVTAQVPVNATV